MVTVDGGETMPIAETRASRGLLRAAWLGFAVLTIFAGTVSAQEPLQASAATAAAGDASEVDAPTANEVEQAGIDELRTMVKLLEARVKELEASGKAPATTAPDEAIPAASQPVETVAGAEKAAPAAAAAPEPQEFPAFFRNTEISGFVDFYYGYNFNRPGIDNQLRNFDTKSSQFAFNLAEIALEKKPTETNRLGFRTDFGFGPASEIVHSYDPGGNDVFRHVQQAYLSYLAPVGKGLQVDVGKFVTPLGAEVIETKDNWNYSRSLLFALAIPYYHFGARATYPVNDKLTLAGYVVNGWNNVVDNNSGKTVGIQAIVKPTSKLTLIQNYFTGPEQTDFTDNDDDWRHLIDTTLIYSATPSLSLMANYDYGSDRIDGTGVHWQGVALYARYQANSWFALAPRFEWYDDHDGFTTGLRQTLKEFTITSEQKISGSLITRLEYRKDFSNEDYFVKPIDRLVSGQSTVTFGIVYAFSSLTDK
jgi:hypothetical protein